MHPLAWLRTAGAAGLACTLLINCSSSGDAAATRGGASNASGSGSDGVSDTGAGPTGAGGSSAAEGATSGGSGATTGAGAVSSTDASSSADGSGNVTTGPLILGGVGGSFVGNRDEGGSTDACQGLAIEFTPDIPTVFILVDRSTSMWDLMYWDALRDGVLAVVERLHEDVRFGFGTFTGIQGNTCPLDLQDVGIIDRNNYAAIAGFYEAIMHPGVATETPTPTGLQRAREILEADNEVFPGPKFIMLVTDGNPDYCDSGQVECRADVTVRVLQDAYSQANIRTFVVALPGIQPPEWLTAFANAGAGEAVSAPVDTQFCDAVPADTAAILPTVTATQWPQGTYGAAMGPLEPYNVDPAQQDQLVEEIAGVIAGIKSCVFDLEGELQIVEGREAEGSVVIQTLANPEGTAQPYDPSGTDGWKVNDGTQIELVGSSCSALRDPETIGIEFGFPCEIIIPK